MSLEDFQRILHCTALDLKRPKQLRSTQNSSWSDKLRARFLCMCHSSPAGQWSNSVMLFLTHFWLIRSPSQLLDSFSGTSQRDTFILSMYPPFSHISHRMHTSWLYSICAKQHLKDFLRRTDVLSAHNNFHAFPPPRPPGQVLYYCTPCQSVSGLIGL